MQKAPRKILIVGCGYIGTALAEKLTHTDEVTGVTSSDKRHSRLRTIGVRPIVTDVQDKHWTDSLPDSADVIVNTIASGGRDYRATYWQSNHDLLEKYAKNPPQHFVYTSSTSVYSQTDGNIVTEQDATEASTPMREVLIETEQMLLANRPFPSIAILRLGGIYGPYRHALLDDLRDGVRSFPEDPNRWINQIHRDDAVGAILHMLSLTPERKIFNVVDDEPVAYGTCLKWLAKKLMIEPPSFDPEAPAQRTRRGPKPHRRISNAKLKATGWAPKYPTFKHGFAQIFVEEAKPISTPAGPIEVSAPQGL
jgi:nucleoside-diphosphate-sugar epimerase